MKVKEKMNMLAANANATFGHKFMKNLYICKFNQPLVAQKFLMKLKHSIFWLYNQIKGNKPQRKEKFKAKPHLINIMNL